MRVVDHELAIGLVVREEAELAVAVEAREVALVAFCLSPLKASFLDDGDPVVLLGVGNCRVDTSFEAFCEGSEVHEAAIAVQSWSYIVPHKELVCVRVEHLSLPAADSVLSQLVQRVEHLSLLWIFYPLNIDPDVDKLWRTFLQLHILKSVKLFLICANSSFEPRHEVFEACLNFLLERVLPALEALDEYRAAEDLAAEQSLKIRQILRLTRRLILILVQIWLLLEALYALDNFQAHLSVYLLLVLQRLLYRGGTCIAADAHFETKTSIYVD